MRPITLFLASSKELAADREKFEVFIRRKNNEWQKDGKPYLKLELWEDTSTAMSRTRSQDEYNKIIPTSDIFVMLIWTKVGKYTLEEYTMAKKRFKETGKPKVYVYQKLIEREKQEQSLIDFTKSLTAIPEEAYFWEKYEHHDSLLLKIEKELNRYYKEDYTTTEAQKDKQSEGISIVQEGEKSIAIAKNEGTINLNVT